MRRSIAPTVPIKQPILGFLKKHAMPFIGAASGIMNGLFGSGGGLIAVPCLEKHGFPVKQSHASAIALTSVFSLISAAGYGFSGNLPISEAVKYIPAGLAGAFAGSLIMKRINPALLKRIFGLVMIYSGARLLWQMS